MSSLILSFLLGLVAATLFYRHFPVAMLRNILLIAANRREFFDCQELVLNIQINESWANLGLWESGDSYSQAGRRMAHELGELARLNSSDSILDIGFGNGDQLQLWRQEFRVKS